MNPIFIRKELSDTVPTRLTFWRIVNNFKLLKFSEKSPFPPLKLFKHSTQLFYSTNGVVVGATQEGEILRSDSSYQEWEQKIVVQTLKKVAVNAFLAWRMFERQDLLENYRLFKSLDSFRNALKKVQSPGEFMFTISKDLLNYANKLRNEVDEAEDGSQEI